MVALAWSIGAGLLLAGSLPPWGFWPLAFLGFAAFDLLLADRPRWSRFRRTTVVALSLFVPTLWWIHDLTLPGYVIAVLAFALMFGLCGTLIPPGRGRHLAVPVVWVLAEVWKGHFPFGGVPISDLAVGQVAGPLAGTAPVGGGLLLTGLAATVGVCLAALVRRQWWAAGCSAAVVVVAGLVGAVAPRGHDIGRPLRVAVVQGGGKQGTLAINSDPYKVFQRHMAASRLIKGPVDLVLWPEDVVDLDAGDIADGTTTQGRQLSALAKRLDATVIAGIVQDSGATHFLNYSVVIDPDGTFHDRYEKVHRVPFGEYVPLRSIVAPFAGPALTQRDAVPGHGPAVLRTRVGTFGVSISWEIFFGERGRSALRDGGQVLLNPTNGSTYTGTLVQTQQVASSRLRALESDRWVLQAAPTGFSAIIRPDGHVVARTSVSERRVLQDRIHRRSGLTLYDQWGDWPAAALVLGLLAAAWLRARTTRT
jgi:apolipoprotein N-acyltransferase